MNNEDTGHSMEIVKVDPAMAELVTRAEYDVQIATARKYPRSIKQFLNEARQLVTLNEQVADDCIYALSRGGKTIEGPSVRFAEIILHAWGHCRAGARIVNEDSKFITAQGICHDLQSNTCVSFEIRRRITDSKGKKYSDDMIAVTANAACSIALRNAIFKVIPKALYEPLYFDARKIAAGDQTTLANKRANAIEALQKIGATKEMVFKKLGVKGVEDITIDHLILLKGLHTSVKDGEVTVEQAFAEDKPSTPATEPATKTDALKAELAANKPAEAPKPEAAATTPAAEPAKPATDVPAQPDPIAPTAAFTASGMTGENRSLLTENQPASDSLDIPGFLKRTS